MNKILLKPKLIISSVIVAIIMFYFSSNALIHQNLHISFENILYIYYGHMPLKNFELFDVLFFCLPFVVLLPQISDIIKKDYERNIVYVFTRSYKKILCLVRQIIHTILTLSLMYLVQFLAIFLLCLVNGIEVEQIIAAIIYIILLLFTCVFFNGFFVILTNLFSLKFSLPIAFSINIFFYILYTLLTITIKSLNPTFPIIGGVLSWYGTPYINAIYPNLAATGQPPYYIFLISIIFIYTGVITLSIKWFSKQDISLLEGNK